MVDGVRMVFKMSKMIERVAKNGQSDMLTRDVIEEMKNLDGQEVSSACWNRQVYGEPVYSCVGKDGRTLIVSEYDCE